MECNKLDILIETETAKVKLNFKELQDRYASVEIPQNIEIFGENKVPYMLVDTYRVLPVIYGEFLYGKNSGSISELPDTSFFSLFLEEGL